MKQRLKRIRKLTPKEQQLVLKAIKKLASGDTDTLDIKALQWKSGLYRLRIWDKRVIFGYQEDGGIEIVAWWSRGDIYK